MAFNLANPIFYGCVSSPKLERSLSFASKPTIRRKQIAGTIKAFAHRGIERPFNYGREHTVERVLRYPDGYERRIRYPVSDDVPSASLSQSSTLETTTEYAATDYVSQDEDFDPNAWTNHAIWNSDSSSSASIDAVNSNTTPLPTPLEHNKQQHPLPRQPDTSESNEVPLSPLALLRLMTSDGYKKEEQRVMQDVASSYTVLANGCPWPVPRPLYILSAVEADQDSNANDDDDDDEEDAVLKQQSPSAGQAYTLRVRLPKNELEDELTKLLGNKTRPDGSSLIRCSELKDGIITFEDEHQAEAFGKLIEGQQTPASSYSTTTKRLTLAKCDSHALFRLSIEVLGVVVLVDKERGVEGLPLPHRLASALRRQDEEGNW